VSYTVNGKLNSLQKRKQKEKLKRVKEEKTRGGGRSLKRTSEKKHTSLLIRKGLGRHCIKETRQGDPSKLPRWYKKGVIPQEQKGSKETTGRLKKREWNGQHLWGD